MKNILIGLLSIMAALSSLNGFASCLVPEQCTIGDRPVSHPIYDIGFTFDGAITVVENSIATIYSDGIPVETGVLSCSNFVWEKRTQGTAVVTFESPLLLPKGNIYQLVVPEGVITREDNPNISNKELTVEFNVPANLGNARPSIEEGSSVEYAGRIGFYFGIETAPVENGKAILLREGIPVREYVCDVSWDWNLGYAGIDFGETIHFEKGIKYSIKIPEGNVSALYRPDIVNKEAEVHFIGSYEEPVKPIQYVWCSLYDHHPTNALGEVKFFYDSPIALSTNPIIQLYIESENLIVKEVVPTISRESEYWVLTADFEDTPLVSEEGYSIIIPEGTLVSEDGDIVVNQRNVMTIGNSSGVYDINDSTHNITVVNGMISIENATNGNNIMLYSLDGKIVYNAKSNGGTVSIPVGTTGIYLLSIDGTTYKIAIRK